MRRTRWPHTITARCMDCSHRFKAPEIGTEGKWRNKGTACPYCGSHSTVLQTEPPAWWQAQHRERWKRRHKEIR